MLVSITCLHSANHMIAKGVLAVTQALVRSALRGEWSRTKALMEERRRLLADMDVDRVRLNVGEENCLAALRQAVLESDRAFATVAAAHGRFYETAACD